MHTNRLINENSPYLLQHAHNPVNWFPWGTEALDLSKKSDKPILVSIGYSACHWCHVMERESFEDAEVAAFMNANFINIKIDREERPDLDHIYMDAVQAMTGSGGWPLNVFLTPELKPFYGGTYFPPKRAFNRISWIEVLNLLHDAWSNRRDEIEEQATILKDHLEKGNSLFIGKPQDDPGIFDRKLCDEMAFNLLKNADKKHGGFGKAPKFPQTFSIQFLLMFDHYTHYNEGRMHAIVSLSKMIHGGIYDHLAGGLCRYSTDEEWLAPHFEKMLYDNALLMSVLSDAYQVTQLDDFKKTLQLNFSFLQTEMKRPGGGFYAALDADSEGEEGKFYVWTADEVRECIPGEEIEMCCEWFDLSDEGNWEGKNILRRRFSSEEFCEGHNISPGLLSEKIEAWRHSLLNRRNTRIRPGTDDKILLGWNALLVTAFCKSYAATGEAIYKEEAIALFDFLCDNFYQDEKWFHSFKNGVSNIPAFADDLAYLIQAALHLQEITGHLQKLKFAENLAQHIISNFLTGDGLFSYTNVEQKDVLLRKKDLYDNATPSANAVMMENLYYLGIALDRTEWKEMSTNALASMKEIIVRYPSSFGIWCSLYLKIAFGYKEIVISGKEAPQMLKDLLRIYIPGKVMMVLTPGSDLPLLEGKTNGDQTAIYLCRDYMCEAPVHTVDDFRAVARV